MHKAYRIGTKMNHRIDFRVNWLSGFASLSYDGKVIYRKSFLFTIDHTAEVGSEEKHVIYVRFKLLNLLQEPFFISINGQRPNPGTEIIEDELSPESPIDDSAAALFFVGLMNVVFSMVGSAFTSELESINVRLLVLLGGLIYVLFGFKTMIRQRNGLIIGTLLFLADSGYRMFWTFSLGGLIVRCFILYYLLLGFVEFKKPHMNLQMNP